MKTNLLNIIKEAEAALAKLEDPAPQPTLKIVPVREGVVRAEWDPALAELSDFDIWFYNVDNHREWQLNIKMHVPDADLSQGYWEIPLNSAGEWRFQARAEGYRSDVVIYNYQSDEEVVEPEEPEDDEQEEEDETPPAVIRRIHIGIWDHFATPRLIPDSLLPYVNIGKTMQRDTRKITEKGIPAIMHLGNLHRETKDQQRKRIRGLAHPGYIEDESLVPIIHFIDEPLANGIEGEDLDQLVDYAREIHGDKFKYAYTINGGELYYPGLRDASTYAQRFDYVFHQSYPYRLFGGESYLRSIGKTKSELFATLDLRLKTLKEKIPNSKFWIVPQGFYSHPNLPKDKRKYDIPPVKSPIWYTEWAMANDVEGLIWWKYWTSGSNWIALDQMPEHMESFKQAFRLMSGR